MKTKNLTFKEALLMMTLGEKVKLPEWDGCWEWKNDSILMHLKDGNLLDIRDMTDVKLTLLNILDDRWEVVQ